LLEFGGRGWGQVPDHAAAIGRLHADGATVLVSEPCLAGLRLDSAALLPGVAPVTTARIAAIAAECDRIWYL
jgi:hypothetical protein